MSHPESATILAFMGHALDVDFYCTAGSPEGCTVVWLSSNPPTDAEIEAAYPAALAAAQRAAIPKVTRRQMLTALHRVGLLPTIKAAVAASEDIELQIAFDEALDFDRVNAFLNGMAIALGKTDAEVDAIFALAASIE